jgi:hypothetical protein
MIASLKVAKKEIDILENIKSMSETCWDISVSNKSTIEQKIKTFNFFYEQLDNLELDAIIT